MGKHEIPDDKQVYVESKHILERGKLRAARARFGGRAGAKALRYTGHRALPPPSSMTWTSMNIALIVRI